MKTQPRKTIRKPPPRSVTHSRTVLVGEPYEIGRAPHLLNYSDDVIIVFGQRFKIKGNPGFDYPRIETLVERYVLFQKARLIEKLAGVPISKLKIQVLTSSHPAKVIVKKPA